MIRALSPMKTSWFRVEGPTIKFVKSRGVSLAYTSNLVAVVINPYQVGIVQLEFRTTSFNLDKICVYVEQYNKGILKVIS